MAHLHALIAHEVTAWKQAGFLCEEFPVISDILEFQIIQSERDLPRESRYLRSAQIEALITYWYLRLIKQTPTMLDLYKTVYPSKSDLRKALGLTSDVARDIIDDIGLEGLLVKVRDDDAFVSTGQRGSRAWRICTGKCRSESALLGLNA